MEIKKNKKASLENKRGIFLQIGFIISLALALVAFEWGSSNKELNKMMKEQEADFESEVTPVTQQQQQQEPPPKPPKVTTEIEVVDDDVEIEGDLNIGDVEADANTETQIYSFEEEEEESESKIFFVVEDPPKFKGGDINTFRKWVQQNLEYPQVARENNISGRVFVSFVVNKDGEVTNVDVKRGVAPSLDEEAKRVVRSSPEWTPGEQRGKAVKVAFTIPIIFVLQ